MRFSILLANLMVLLAPAGVQAQKSGPFAYDLVKRQALVLGQLDAELKSLDTLYKYLHSHPELSYEEEKTAARLAKELRTLGFTVTEKVGGHGIVGVLKNGAGPTVLIRTDMDALPIVEKTGVAYASKIRTRDKEGRDVGIMHACGHDMHMTCWVGTARVLANLKKHWRGTLVFIGQPAEEVGAGARMMLQDGLFKRFPRPDYCLGLHCDSRLPHGHVGYTEGLSLVNVDSVDILVKGKGGHGSAPHTTIDPIVISARIILDLQTLVSRENNPLDPAVVTVGSIHGGTKHNIIPAEVKMQLTVRSTRDDVRARLLEGIQRITKAAAFAAKAPEPVVRIEQDNFTPALYNTVEVAKKTSKVFRAVLGDDKVHEQKPLMGGEDFSRYIREGVPGFFFFLGTLPPERVEAMRMGKAPPISLHSDLYYPVPEPSMRTGVMSMSMAALNLLKTAP
ncbi:MAG: amidohydrolase [Planctomycetes bacterium]|nr:amidohydrolase [Planctomycetota bacterium]